MLECAHLLVLLLSLVALTHGQNATCNIDICLAIDRHDSISEVDWQHQLNFVSLFAGYLNIEKTFSRVGLVSFDQIATLDIKLRKHSTENALQNDIEGQPYGGFGRDISLGLRESRTGCFTAFNGDRSEQPNYAVIITNGVSDEADALLEADLLKAQGVPIISVGIGSGDDEDLLDLLTGISGDATKVYMQESFEKLEGNPALFLHLICPGFGDFPKVEPPILISIPAVSQADTEYFFECSFNYSDTQDLAARYNATFFVSGTEQIGEPVVVVPPAKSALMSSTMFAGKMGRNVTCEVMSYWVDTPEEKGPTSKKKKVPTATLR